MALSDVAIKKALPKEKVYRLYDGDGLYLAVYPNGKKGWRLRYKRQGKETMLSLGSYPSVSLKDARVERDKINILRSKDIDPSAERRRSVEKVKTEQTTFMKVKDEWLEKHRPPVWSQAHYDKTVIRLKHVLALHETSIADITPPMILDILRPIEARGTHETAHRVLGICSMIFRYAVATGQVISDPCRDLSGAFTPVVVTNNATITNPLGVGKLLLDIDAYVGSAVVHRALRLAPLVFLRQRSYARRNGSR